MAQDPTLPLEEFAQSLEPNQRLFGLDLGSKTIGIAVSDLTRSIATPVETIRRKKFKDDVAILLDLIREYEVAGII
ncbi:MAG: RuvX/YqgF family protein, partial [Methyloligellaceae bacterium]